MDVVNLGSCKDRIKQQKTRQTFQKVHEGITGRHLNSVCLVTQQVYHQTRPIETETH